MKKIILFTLLVFTFLNLVTVRAEDLQINIEPSEIWIGDSISMGCWYSGINGTPDTPYAIIEHINQNSLWTKNDFTPVNETHFDTNFNPPLLGNYKTICTNGVINSSETTFKMSELSFSITDSPDVGYLDDKIVVHANVIKTSDADEMITSNVDFDLFLNGKAVQIDNDATYSLAGEWIITTEKLLDSEFSPSTYALTVNATYMGESASSTENIQIKYPVEFELIHIDKTEVLPEDNITITLKATDRENPIPLQDLQLKFQISDQQTTILSTSQIGNNLDIIISAPSLSPGSYTMLITVTYGDYRWEHNSATIDYGVPITVSMKDSSNTAVATQFRFLIDGIEKKRFITGPDGSFSGYIPPDTYDIELSLSNSQLILYGVIVNDFDNPIKFDHPSADVNIPGIGVGDVYVFEVALSYSDAYLEFKYDSSKILDENEITVYKCGNWNFGRRICSEDWKTVSTEIDTIRDSIKINTSSLSAYLVGYKKEMTLNFETDKDEYFLADVIKVTGIVEDEDGKAAADVQITASVIGTEISASGETDSGGVFTFEFIGPDQEDDYDIFLEAKKQPFSSINSSKTIKVVRSSQLSIILPESIKLNQGETSSMWVSIVNIGQTDFSDLTLSLSGIPEDYYILSEINELKAGDEIKVATDFTIPENAGKTTHTGKMRITYDDTYLEEQFILSILGVEENETSTENTGGFKFPNLSFPTGKIVLPDMNIEILIIAIPAVFVFSFAVLFKKKRRITVEPERSNVKNLLLDIKREVGRPLVDVSKTESLKNRVIEFRKTLKNKNPNDF